MKILRRRYYILAISVQSQGGSPYFSLRKGSSKKINKYTYIKSTNIYWLRETQYRMRQIIQFAYGKIWYLIFILFLENRVESIRWEKTTARCQNWHWIAAPGIVFLLSWETSLFTTTNRFSKIKPNRQKLKKHLITLIIWF